MKLAQWTVLFYVAADNDLNIGPDIRAMKEAASNPLVNVIVETIVHGGKTTRLKITKDRQEELGRVAGKSDTAAPEPLTRFIKWGLSRYPSRRTAVILSSHGSGLEMADRVRVLDGRRSVAHLTVSELAQAFQRTGRKVDVIGLDACLMGMTEVAYQLRNRGSFLVASEVEEPFSWPYAKILGKLAKSPDTSPDALAKTIVRVYGKTFAKGQNAAISSVDLAQVGSLGASFRDLVSAVAGTPKGEAQVKRSRSEIPPFHGVGDYVDLSAFVSTLQKQLPEASKQAASVRTALGRAVTLRRTTGPADAKYGGLSLFYPEPPIAKSTLRVYEPLKFPTDTGWGRLLPRVT
jgi:hypothetical protein